MPQRNPVAAGSEYAALVLAVTAYYWSLDDFQEDWDYSLTWEDQRRRWLTPHALCFDSNAFTLNAMHAFGGAPYYTIGRANGLTPLESFWLVLAESLYWEYVVEWREVVSVNDTLSTLFGGVSIGESWYQLAAHLNARDGGAARALGFIHPVMGVQALMGRRWPEAFSGEGMPGYGVSLSAGAMSTDSRIDSVARESLVLGLRSRLVDPEAFLMPGEGAVRVRDTLSSELRATISLDGGKVRGADFFSRAVLDGKVSRRLDAEGRGLAVGIGVGSAFTFRRIKGDAVYDGSRIRIGRGDDLNLAEPRDFRDKQAIIHTLGPVVEGVWRGGKVAVSFLAELYPDFGLVNAYALNEYSAGRDISGMKTTMLYYGYYYGWGGSLMARIEGEMGPFSAGLAGELHRIASIEGLDRFEDDLDADPHANDAWDRLRASVGIAIPGTPLRLEGSAEWSSRRGRIGEAVTADSEARYLLAVLWSL